MDAPLQAEMAMVIGNRRVPLAKVRLANSEGEFEEHLLANLSQRPSGPDGKRLLTSIWNVTGGTRPWNVPLVAEIKEAIASLRIKKDRQGNIYGANGKPLPGIVPVTVRGQNLLAETNVQHVRVALGDSLDVMNWFLKELWNDLQHAPGAGPRVVREDTFKEQYLEESLGKLRAHKRVKSASYDPHNKRIRVCVQGNSKKNQYVNVKPAHALLAEDDVDGVEEFLSTAVVRMLGSLDVDPGDHELHAPGEEDRGATRQDDARRDATRQYKTRQDKTRQDKTRQEKRREENIIQYQYQDQDQYQ